MLHCCMKSLPVLRVTFLTMAAALVATLAVTYIFGRKTIERSRAISVRETSMRQVQEMFSTLQDMETGQRGFLLTGRTEYLEPYTDALDELPARLRHLRNAAQQGEISPALVERLQHLVD